MKNRSKSCRMQIKRIGPLFLIVMALVALAAPLRAPLYAEQRELSTDPSDKLDAVLVIDASGSMLLTDPLKLRYEGAKLLIEALKEGDRLGIVSFASSAKVERALSPVSSGQSEELAAQINSIEASGDFTDLYSGIQLAKEQFLNDPREDARQVMILLSDGKMDPNPALSTADARTRDLIDNVLPETKAKDIKIYTLYFSDLADKEILSQIAAATDGLNWFTPSADKIHESYTSLFLAVKKPQIVPLTSKGFTIDQDVQEATFYINREQGGEPALISPAGQRYDVSHHSSEVKWFRSQKFDVITVSKPDVGSWQVEGLTSQEGFATVLTNMKLVTDWSSSIYSGSSYLLQARMYEGDRPVVLPEMTGAAQYAFQITPTDRVSEPVVREFLADDGTHGDKIANDGIFSGEIRLDEPGEYKLTILVKAPTFERTQQVPFRVKPRFVSLRAEELETEPGLDSAPATEGHAGHAEGAAEGHADEHASAPGKLTQFVVELSPEAAGFSKIKVAVKAIDQERKRFDMQPVVRSKDKSLVYRVSSKVLASEGKYKIQAFVSGESKKGELEEESNVIEYEHRPLVGGEEVEYIAVEPEHKDPIWWPYPIVILLINCGLGFVLLQSLKKSQTELSFAMPALPAVDDISKELGKIREQASLSEVDLNDPRLSKDFVSPLAESGAASAAAASESAAPAPAEPAPEAAPEAEAAEAEPAEASEEAQSGAAPAESSEEES